MLFVANVLRGVAYVLDMAVGFAILLVIVWCVLSWVNADPYNPIVRFVRLSVEPLIRPLRRRLPLVGGGLDLSPLILVLILYFLRYALIYNLGDYAEHMRRQALFSDMPNIDPVRTLTP